MVVHVLFISLLAKRRQRHRIDMTFVKENEYKKYIQDNFMNQAITKHLENQTGSNNSFKPIKIKKNNADKKYETWK